MLPAAKIRVIRALWKTAPHLSLKEISERTGIPPGTIIAAMFPGPSAPTKVDQVARLRMPSKSESPAARQECAAAIQALSATGHVVPRVVLAVAIAEPIGVVDGALAGLRAGNPVTLVASTFRLQSDSMSLITRAIGWNRTWFSAAIAAHMRAERITESIPTKQTPAITAACERIVERLQAGFALPVTEIAEAAKIPMAMVKKIILTPQRGWTAAKLRKVYNLPKWQASYLARVHIRFHDIPGAGEDLAPAADQPPSTHTD